MVYLPKEHAEPMLISVIFAQKFQMMPYNLLVGISLFLDMFFVIPLDKNSN